MALSGNLKEFELADIFQLIGQQKKTGRLLLEDGEHSAWAVFKEGVIVSAGSDSEDIITLFVNYLIECKHVPRRKLDEFLEYCKGSAALFVDIIIKIQYCTDQEADIFAGMAVEDLACNLFGWRKGSYRFEALARVDNQVIRTIACTIDSIIMEAMRRIDEWKRFSAYIRPESVFVTTPNGRLVQPDLNAILAGNMAPFVALMLDGKSSVADIAGSSFISQYRLCEQINAMLQDGRIVPSTRQMATIQTPAISEGERQHQAHSRDNIVSLTFAAIAIAFVLLLGVVLFPRTFERSCHEAAQAFGESLPVTQKSYKTRIGQLQYQADSLREALTPGELAKARYLAPSDL